MVKIFKLLEFTNNGTQGPIKQIQKLLWSLVYGASVDEKPVLNQRQKARYSHYSKKLESAKTYEEWFKAASILDELDGYSKWKETDESDEYDYKLLQSRIDEIVKIRSNENDRKAMCFALKLGLARNLGNMGNIKLYEHSRVGTKKLISNYTHQLIDQLEWIGDTSDNASMSLKEKHEYFMNLRQSYGRTALLLSGGGTLGFSHIGVLRTLINSRLLPRVVSGASAGSIMAALICTRNNEERIKFINEIENIPTEVFYSNSNPDTNWTRIKRYFQQGSLYDSSYLRNALRQQCSDMTFQEAYNVSRLHLNITISPSTVYEMPRVLNHITAPNVVIWSAVMASCAVPVVFKAGSILAKDKKGNQVPWTPTDDTYLDGSMDNDLPMKRLSELFNVNHFIVIQVNPYIAPILEPLLKKGRINRIRLTCLKMVFKEILHRFQQLKDLGIGREFGVRAINLFSQTYVGHITIVPEVYRSDLKEILGNLGRDAVDNLIERGQKATWAQMPKIQNSLQIELAIDSIIHKLRKEMLGDSPQLTEEQFVSLPSASSIQQISRSISSSEATPTSIHVESENGIMQDDDLDSSSYLQSINSQPSPYGLPSTPFWQTNLDESMRQCESPISTSVSMYPFHDSNALLPHDISRKGSNASIRDISKPSTRFERRKQVTSTQFFILPEFEWLPERSLSESVIDTNLAKPALIHESQPQATIKKPTTPKKVTQNNKNKLSLIIP